MDSATELKIAKGETPAPLRWSLTAGVLAWFLDLGSSYSLQRQVCSSHERYLLHVVTCVCLLISLSGLAYGWRVFKRLPPEKNEEGPAPHDRAHFQALLAIGFSVAFSVALLALAVPRWLAPLCG